MALLAHKTKLHYLNNIRWKKGNPLWHSFQSKQANGHVSKILAPLTLIAWPDWLISAVQKIKKLSETPVTVHNIAKLCVIDGKNREITKN